eukprot:gene651-1197_t
MGKTGRWGSKKSGGGAAQSKTPVLEARLKKIDLPGNEPNSKCVMIENYFTIVEESEFFDALKTGIAWEQKEVHFDDGDGRIKTRTEPRYTAFYSDTGIVYAYNKRDNVGLSWTPQLLMIKKKAEEAVVKCGFPPVEFNACHLNKYDGPSHSMGMHCDDEADLKQGAPIGSCSFGAERNFTIQHKSDENLKTNVCLTPGSFICMGGDMQNKYLHGLPPQPNAKGARINLTFRVCIPRGGQSSFTQLDPHVKHR